MGRASELLGGGIAKSSCERPVARGATTLAPSAIAPAKNCRQQLNIRLHIACPWSPATDAVRSVLGRRAPYPDPRCASSGGGLKNIRDIGTVQSTIAPSAWTLGFNYGNGLVYSQSLDTRLRPYVIHAS